MRSCGILMHISSLPSPYGIGTFGAEAEKFADWLKEAGQKYWQVLPIGPTGYGDSPYQPFSSFAGNPLLIDLDELVEHGYLAKKSLDNSDYGADPSYVDFDIVNRNKTALLREAFAGFTDDVGYTSFITEEQDWLDNYALFMALKDKFGGRPWSDWDDDIKLREPEAVKRWTEELKDDIKFYKFVQYIFYRQWDRFHRYCSSSAISRSTSPRTARTSGRSPSCSSLMKSAFPSALREFRRITSPPPVSYGGTPSTTGRKCTRPATSGGSSA